MTDGSGPGLEINYGTGSSLSWEFGSGQYETGSETQNLYHCTTKQTYSNFKKNAKLNLPFLKKIMEDKESLSANYPVWNFFIKYSKMNRGH